MYPKNFIDYKLYIRRLSLPSFISDWFGGKNTCYNKIAREALKNNLDINELLINVCFQIINELQIDSSIRNMIIGNIIDTMIQKQHSFQSFKYYKYGEIEYQNKLNDLHNKYQILKDNYELEMNKIVQEREKLRETEFKNLVLEEKILDLENLITTNKNIHDSKDKEIELLRQEMEYKLDEKDKLIQDLQESIKKEKDNHQIFIIDHENQKDKDLNNLIDKFESDFNLLKEEKEKIQLCFQRTLTERNYFENKYKEQNNSSTQIRSVNGNNNTYENREFNKVSETLDAVIKALSMATSELENRCRDNILPKQFTRYTESIGLCLSPIGLYKYVKPEYLNKRNNNSNYSRNNNNSNHNSYKSNYHERRNDNPPSISSSSNNQRNQRSSNKGKYWKPDYIKNSPGIKAVYETEEK